MDICGNDHIPSEDELLHDVEHGDHHMDGELCGMGEGSHDDSPLTPEDLEKAMGGES